MKLSIISVATGSYLDYWMKLVRSICKQDCSNFEINLWDSDD